MGTHLDSNTVGYLGAFRTDENILGGDEWYIYSGRSFRYVHETSGTLLKKLTLLGVCTAWL